MICKIPISFERGGKIIKTKMPVYRPEWGSHLRLSSVKATQIRFLKPKGNLSRLIRLLSQELATEDSCVAF